MSNITKKLFKQPRKQNKKNQETEQEIERLEFFLKWYKNSFVLKGIGYSNRSHADIDLSLELQEEIWKLVENYVIRKKKELEAIKYDGK